MKTLIVIDMQNDFVTGTLGTIEAQAILPNVKKKIEEYREHGDEIIFTRDTHFSDTYIDSNEGKNLPIIHCIKNTQGWDIVEEIDITDCEHIDKTSFGYSYWDLKESNKGIDKRNFEEIEIIGVCTDICVVSNALILKALFPEISITVDASCCAGVTPESHKHALETMKMCQISVINEIPDAINE